MTHSKEEVQKAISIINEHRAELSKHYIHEYTCICCQINKIKPLYADNIHPLKQEQGTWDNGVVQLITPGFGSRFDMTSFYAGICDDCINQFLKLDNMVVLYEELKFSIRLKEGLDE